MKYEANRDARFVRQVSHDVGLRFLGDGGEEVWRACATRTTLFILGSGSSIESISPSGFDTIRTGLSVGVNAWPLHDFIPDVYAYEPVNDEKSDHIWTLSMLDRPDILKSNPDLLILRPRNELERSQLSQIPESLAARTYLYGRVIPATREIENLSSDLFRYFGRASRRGAVTVLPDSGATIVRLASLGLLLGYKKIVFVGVDLNNSRYFWEENPEYLKRRGFDSFDSGQRQPIHETMIPQNRPFIVTEMIRALSDVGRRLTGAEFFVASESSALAEFIPVYNLEKR